MYKPKNNYEDVFANLAKSSQSWFNNLLGHKENKPADANAFAFVNMYQQFFENTKSANDVMKDILQIN